MSKQYTITLQAANTAAPATAITPIAQGGQQVIIKGAKGQNYQLIETATGKGPREIIARKKGQHLEITFEGGNPATPDLIIEQYYDDLGAKLLGEAESGKLYHYIPTSNETAAAIPNLSELAQASQVLGGESLLAPFYLPLAAGAGAAAAGAGFLLPALAALGAGAVLFKSDDTAPAAAALVVKTAGVGDTVKSIAQAIDPEIGVATVTAALGTTTVVTLKGKKGTVTKTLTGTGAAQAVTLSPEDLKTLGDGDVTVTTVTTDKATGQTVPPQVISPDDFTLNTAAPSVKAQGLGDPVKTPAAATGPEGVATVTAEQGAITVVTLKGINGTITKTLIGTGAAQPVVLTPEDIAALGAGPVVVTATTTNPNLPANDPNKTIDTLTGAQADFTIDTAAPNVSAQGLGDYTKTAASATDLAGVASINAPTGTTTVVTLVGPNGTITKTLTGTGAAQPVVLTPADLATLGTGTVIVTAITTDKATGKTTTTLSGPQADFTIDTAAPIVSAKGLGDTNKTAAEATDPAGVASVKAPAGTNTIVTLVGQKGTITIDLGTSTGTAQAVTLTPEQLKILGEGMVVVTAVTTDKATGKTTTTLSGPQADFNIDTVVNTPTVTPAVDGSGKPTGAVTIAPPADTDLTKLTISFKDETGTPQTLIATKDPVTGKWSLPAGTPATDATINPDTGAITMPADATKDGEPVTVVVQDQAGNQSPTASAKPDEAPKAAVITPSADPALKGQVTVTPPTTAAESDLKSMTVAYTDEAGNPQTITLNKAPDGTWSPAAALPPGVTLDTNTGVLVMGPDVTKDGSTVTVTTIDNANQSTPVTGTAGDEAPKAAVITPSADPALKGQVTVTPPTTAAESDLKSMTVAYTDEAGNPQTITLNKAPDGTWSAAAALPPGVTLDTSTGALVMGPDVTKDGSTVTVTTIDNANQSTPVTGTAGDEAPKAAVITPSADPALKGQVTVTPPTTAAESDLTSMTVAYTDEAGNPQTITLNKAPDGTWSAAALPPGVTLDTSTGALVMGPDVTQDGSTVTVTTKDAAGQTTVATGPAGDEAPKAAVITPDATVIGQVTVTPPTTAAESDLTSMTVAYTDEAGKPQTITLNKAADGTWSAAAAIPTGVTLDTSTGALVMGPDVTQDGSTVTVTTKDAAGQTTVATGPAGDEKPLAGAVSVPATGADAGKTLVTPPTSAAESDLASMDITFTNEAGTEVTVTATKTAGVWSLPASAPSGMSIDPGTGVVSMLPDVTQDGSTVTVTTKDAAGQTTVATGPAGDEAPKAAVITPSADPALKGQVTVTPPTTAAESDLKSMTVAYTDETGTEQTITLNKAADGTWSAVAALPPGVTLDPATGVLVMAPDVTKDGSTVTVTTIDNAGQSTPVTGTAGDEAPKAAVITPDATVIGQVTVTPPTTAAESDLKSMTVAYTDETGTAQTITLNKAADGTWTSAAAALPPGVTLDPATGVLVMAPDVTKDGSTVTVTTIDNAGQSTPVTGTAGDEAPAAPAVTAASTGIVTVTPPVDADLAKMTISYTDEAGVAKTLVATRAADGAWSLPTGTPDTVATITSAGVVTMPADATKDGSPVSVVASGAAPGNDSPAGSATPNEAPPAPTVTAAADGIVTIKPPVDPDLASMTISYTDETGAAKTLVATKDPVTGAWSLPAGTPTTVASIAADGTITMPADATKDGSPVSVVAKDGIGQSSPAGSATPNEAPPAPSVTAGTSGAADGVVTITPPTDPDLASMTISYTDEAGVAETLVATRAADGAWSLPTGTPDTVATITSAGVVTMPADATKDGSPVSVVAKDGIGQSSPAGSATPDEAPVIILIAAPTPPGAEGLIKKSYPITDQGAIDSRNLEAKYAALTPTTQETSQSASVAAGYGPMASSITGLIYLKAGDTISFSGQHDGSAHIELGGTTLLRTNGGSYGGYSTAGGPVGDMNDAGTAISLPNGTTTFDNPYIRTPGTYTVPNTGYYTLEALHYNGGGAGSFTIQASINGGASKELNTTNFDIYPDEASLGTAHGAYIDNSTNPGDGGYYPVANAYNEGIEGTEISLSSITSKLAPNNADATLTTTLEGLAQGDIITAKNAAGTTVSLTAGANGIVDVSGLNLSTLTFKRAPDADTVTTNFDITVKSIATDAAHTLALGNAVTQTGTITVKLLEAAAGPNAAPTITLVNPTLGSDAYVQGLSEWTRIEDFGDSIIAGKKITTTELQTRSDNTTATDLPSTFSEYSEGMFDMGHYDTGKSLGADWFDTKKFEFDSALNVTEIRVKALDFQRLGGTQDDEQLGFKINGVMQTIDLNNYEKLVEPNGGLTKYGAVSYDTVWLRALDGVIGQMNASNTGTYNFAALDGTYTLSSSTPITSFELIMKNPSTSTSATNAAASVEIKSSSASSGAPGMTLSSLVSSNDTNGVSDLKGYAVTDAQTSAAGTWEYQTSGANAWTSINVSSASSAVYLNASDKLRWKGVSPDDTRHTALSVVAVDSTVGATPPSSGASIDASAQGGTNAFSAPVTLKATQGYIAIDTDGDGAINTTGIGTEAWFTAEQGILINNTDNYYSTSGNTAYKGFNPIEAGSEIARLGKVLGNYSGSKHTLNNEDLTQLLIWKDVNGDRLVSSIETSSFATFYQTKFKTSETVSVTNDNGDPEDISKYHVSFDFSKLGNGALVGNSTLVDEKLMVKIVDNTDATDLYYEGPSTKEALLYAINLTVL